MIIDTSAVVALIQGETPYAEQVAGALAGDRSPVMAAPSVVECLIVLTARHGPIGRTLFDRVRTEINLGVGHFTEEHAVVAHRAYLEYGKGRHPAALNFGDAMTYAAAKVSGESLIAVGDDFPRTDLVFDGVIGHWK